MRRFILCLLLFLVAEPVMASPAAAAQVPNVGINGMSVTSEELLARLGDTLLLDSLKTLCSEVESDFKICREIQKSGITPSSSLGRVLVVPRLAAALRIWRSVRQGNTSAARCMLTAVREQPFDWDNKVNTVMDITKLTTRCLGPAPTPQGATLSLLEISNGGKEIKKANEDQDPMAKYRRQPVSPENMKPAPQDTSQFVHPQAPLIALYLCLALAIGTVLSLALGFSAGWGLTPKGWENGFQTQVNVTGVWLEMISVFTLLSLTFAVKLYQAYKRLREAKLFHEPYNSAGSMDEGVAMMQKVQLLNSLDTFLSQQGGLVAMILPPDQDRSTAKPLTFEEWNDPQSEYTLPDPMRVLVKFFYMDREAMERLAEKDIHFHHPDDPDKLLRQVYDFRVVALTLKRARRDGNVQEIAKARAERAMLFETVKKGLQPSWRNLERRLAFDSEVSESDEAFQETEGWGSFLLAAGMIVSQIYSFLDASPECPPLNDLDLNIKQRQTRLRTDLVESPSPYTYNAIRYTCTHGNTKNVEEGAICSLLCKPGHTAMYGLTVCDSLGGAGMAWTHLNEGVSRSGSGQSPLDMASCCVTGPDAEMLSSFNVTMDDTTAWYAWTHDTGFAHACGSNQIAIVQACAFNPSDVASLVSPDEACSLYCEGENAEHCFTQTNPDIVPREKWAVVDGTDHESQDFKDLTEHFGVLLGLANAEVKLGEYVGSIKSLPALSATSQLLFRIGVTNRFGTTYGPWKPATE